MKSRSIKKINYLLAVICILCAFLICLFQWIPKVYAQESTEISENVYHDILNGTNGTCYSENVVTKSIDSDNLCNAHSVTHGPGRENGGTDILATGCRNYMGTGFKYGTTNIPYWINMNSMNLIANTTHRNQVISDIRYQLSLWNTAIMHDGTGQVVNFYEVSPGTTVKPNKINGKEVIEVLQEDLTASGWAGLFSPSKYSVTLSYNHTTSAIGYNPDTVAHEFGHVLGLEDIDPANGVASGTHKTLMSYNRNCSYYTIDNAIKYQDIQGVASFNNQHTEHDYKRYVYDGKNYLHICYYCDRIDEQSFAKSASSSIVDKAICSHMYEQFISLGEKHWLKCTKCYKVIESEFTVNVHPVTYEIELLHFLNTSKNTVSIPTQIGGQSVTSIGENAFENCINLTAVSVHGSIVSIGAQAFSGCSSLANITIPASVTNIGTGAFAGCNNLNITVAASNPNYSAQGNILYDKLKTKIIATGKINSSITIPETVTEITPYAFEGNSNLTTVHISNSADIGIHAFANCENLETVYFYSYNVPEIGTSAFTGDNFTVYVPYSKQAAYNVVFQGYLARIESLHQIKPKSNKSV